MDLKDLKYNKVYFFMDLYAEGGPKVEKLKFLANHDGYGFFRDSKNKTRRLALYGDSKFFNTEKEANKTLVKRVVERCGQHIAQYKKNIKNNEDYILEEQEIKAKVLAEFSDKV
jgi:hypothetical protein